MRFCCYNSSQELIGSRWAGPGHVFLTVYLLEGFCSRSSTTVCFGHYPVETTAVPVVQGPRPLTYDVLESSSFFFFARALTMFWPGSAVRYLGSKES